MYLITCASGTLLVFPPMKRSTQPAVTGVPDSRPVAPVDASVRGRGRPPKFGRPSRVVALTLPEDTIQALNEVDEDTGWAIVKLLEDEPVREARRPKQPDVELVTIAARRSLIVVNRALFHRLPGVSIVPLTATRAFLALEVGRGVSDLELVVIDQLAVRGLAARERRALQSLRRHLAEWRHDHGLAFHTRAIIVVEETAPRRRTAAATVRPRRTAAVSRA